MDPPCRMITRVVLTAVHQRYKHRVVSLGIWFPQETAGTIQIHLVVRSRLPPRIHRADNQRSLVGLAENRSLEAGHDAAGVLDAAPPGKPQEEDDWMACAYYGLENAPHQLLATVGPWMFFSLNQGICQF